MRQQVLKALANPARIFYVPYSLAVLNFAVQYVLFIVAIGINFIFTGAIGSVVPMVFLISVIVTHIILIGMTKSEPQLANIIVAKIKLFQRRVPMQMEV
ncbi:MAG: VirB3 family type IV secretion system protein [Alphaproteobacteria bacterium]|nr:VirB3 family type IV secretion system protein [Alphaproteobacteria bacterium]MCL2889632.1 VirB3 family type IV secretion system protein [Alphaproteobacteria bacterium]